MARKHESSMEDELQEVLQRSKRLKRDLPAKVQILEELYPDADTTDPAIEKEEDEAEIAPSSQIGNTNVPELTAVEAAFLKAKKLTEERVNNPKKDPKPSREPKQISAPILQGDDLKKALAGFDESGKVSGELDFEDAQRMVSIDEIPDWKIIAPQVFVLREMYNRWHKTKPVEAKPLYDTLRVFEELAELKKTGRKQNVSKGKLELLQEFLRGEGRAVATIKRFGGLPSDIKRELEAESKLQPRMQSVVVAKNELIPQKKEELKEPHSLSDLAVVHANATLELALLRQKAAESHAQNEKMLHEWQTKLPQIDQAISRLRDSSIKVTYLYPDTIKDEKQIDNIRNSFADAADRFEAIKAHIESGDIESIPQENIDGWKDYEKQDGLIQTELKKYEQLLEEKKEVKAALPKPPMQLPQFPNIRKMPDFSETLQNKMELLGITPEILEGVPEFVAIRHSEGKMEWFLDKLLQVVKNRTHHEAVEQFEIKHRKAGFKGKLLRKIKRNGHIKNHEDELFIGDTEKGRFNVEKYNDDVKGLLHLASVAPEMIVEIDVKGNRDIVVDYLGTVEGLKPEIARHFNRAATAYAKLPPENEWVKKSPKVRAEYEKIKEKYNYEKGVVTDLLPMCLKSARRNNVLEVKPYRKEEALRFVSEKEFEVLMHQTINMYPHAELELKELAESKGWIKEWWRNIKTYTGIQPESGAIGAAIGVALARGTIRSTIAWTGLAAASPIVLPVFAVASGAAIGAMRGGMNAKERIRREEELMRLGRGEKKKIVIEEKGSTESQIQKKKELINKAREKSTQLNFVEAETMVRKITDLTEVLDMDYGTFITNPPKTIDGEKNRYQNISSEEFSIKQKHWSEQLEVRLEYITKKLDQHKVSFKNDSLSSRYELIKAMADASVKLTTKFPHFSAFEDLPQKNVEYAGYQNSEGKDVYKSVVTGPRSGTSRKGEFISQFSLRDMYGNNAGQKTRRTMLERVLEQAEKNIKNNRDAAVLNGRIWGGVTGGVFSAVMAGAGFGVSKALGSEVIHSVSEKAQDIKARDFLGGRNLDLATHHATEQAAAVPVREALIPKVLSESSLSSPYDANGNVLNIPLDPSTPLELEENSVLDKVPTIEPSEAVVPNSNSVEPLGNVISSDVSDIDNNNVEEIVTIKPKEYVLRSSDSREWALKRFFIEEHQLDPKEAGKQAHEYFRDEYGQKGERALPFTHAGDKVSIVEQNGKPVINIIPKHAALDSVPQDGAESVELIKDRQLDQFTGRKIGGDSAERAVTRMLRIRADEYGFAGDLGDKQAVKEWADQMTKEVLAQNKGIETAITHDGDMLDLSRTPDGKWFAHVDHPAKGGGTVVDMHTSPEDAPVVEPPLPDAKIEASFSGPIGDYKVEGASDLPNVLRSTLETGEQFRNLSSAEKDKVVYAALTRYLDAAKEREGLFTVMGITSGNPFDIKDNTLALDLVLGPDDIEPLFEAAKKVPDSAIGLLSHSRDIAEMFKGSDPKEIKAEGILSLLESLKKARR